MVHKCNKNTKKIQERKNIQLGLLSLVDKKLFLLLWTMVDFPINDSLLNCDIMQNFEVAMSVSEFV
jgi:hypothetical protein